MQNVKTLMAAAGLMTALAAVPISAGELAYTYTLSAGNSAVGGATPGLSGFLNDGVYSADQASAVVAWDGTDGVGVIFQYDVVATLDLGSVQTIDSILIDYQVWDPAGVPAWESVDVSIDGNFVTSYANFPAELGTDVDYQRVIDLSGNSGQVIELTFDRRLTTGSGIEDWGPLSEIDVYDSPVPEPSSLALLGLGGLMIARRRRA